MQSWWCILGVIPILEALYTNSATSCPILCSCDSDVTNCQNTSLVDLPSGIDIDVTYLDLSHNNFSNIPQGIQSFSSLKTLNLLDNKIATIGHSDFEGLVNLEELDLALNSFHDWKDVQSRAFTKLAKLVYLDISHNRLGNLPNFSNQLSIKSLKILRVNDCSMTSIPKALFNNLKNIEQLYSAHNPVRILNGTFESDTLTHMDLSHCELTDVSDDVFENLKRLDTLIMRNNIHLKKLQIRSDSLKILDLSGSNLDSIPDGSLKALEVLNLYGNSLRTIPDDSFSNYSNLRVLNLSFNVLTTIEPNAFRYLEMLSSLDLSINKLMTISTKTFIPTIALSRLNISHNYINSLKNFNSNSLNVLDASFCEMNFIEKYNLPELTHLYLRKNKINSLPDSWDASNLIFLDLKQCEIRSIGDHTFQEMTSLISLDLSNNRLSHIHPKLFPSPIASLKLGFNQWICNCNELKDMYYLMLYSEQDVEDLICDSPEKVIGQHWESACQQEWNPPKRDQLWWYSTGLIVSMAVLLVVVLALRKMSDVKEKRWREEEERRRNDEREAREALQRMQRLQRELREEANRNAPDPRESQGPPSYSDALLLPKLPSLSGSMHSLASRGSLHGSNPDINKKGRRRKRRRRKSDSSEAKRQSQASVDIDDTDDELEVNRRPMESDF